jgi:hypothetical protein
MKQLKFNSDLVALVLHGTKTCTWRLFDDKDLKVGDQVEFLDSATQEKFAEAEILSVVEKRISEISSADRKGHEPVGEGQELLDHYQKLYNRPVSPDELVKIIRFETN